MQLLVEILCHQQMLLQMGQISFARETFEVGIFTALAIALKKRHRVLMSRELQLIVFLRKVLAA